MIRSQVDSSKYVSSHLALECISTCVSSDHLCLDRTPLYANKHVHHFRLQRPNARGDSATHFVHCAPSLFKNKTQIIFIVIWKNMSIIFLNSAMHINITMKPEDRLTSWAKSTQPGPNVARQYENCLDSTRKAL